MINSEHEILVDLSTNCTIDVAVAKLLGWMSGPVRSRVIRLTEHRIPEDQLPSLHSMEGSLEEQLEELREAARQEFVAALEAGASYEVLKAKEAAVYAAEALIHKAHKFILDICEELAGGEDSAIEVDREETEHTGATHLTLRSLDRWARKKYRISILEGSDSPLPSEGTAAQAPAPDEAEESGHERGLSKTRAHHFLTTFAFLVEAFISRAEKRGDNLNISEVAKHIEKLAKAANKGQPLNGQSAEAIKDRIEKAMRKKKERLPQR